MFSKSFTSTVLGGAFLFFTSLQADAQSVCLYEHANFQGNSICLHDDQSVDNLASGGLNDRISSISIRNNVSVTVCEHANYQGSCRTFNSDVYNLADQGFNDRISSIRVQPGGWQPQPTPDPWTPQPTPWNPPPQPPPYQGYGLQAFANAEQNAIVWNQRYNAAPSGSWEESNARQQRDQSIQQALSSISGYGAFQGMPTSQIEGFADQMNQKYNAAPPGSAMENFYRQARQIAYQAFNNSLQQDVQNLQYTNDWRQMHSMALDLDQKYNAAPSGSAKETAYNQARQTAWRSMPNSVAQEVQQTANFSQIENLAGYFESLYNAAPSGSLKEQTYSQIKTQTYQAAVSRFQQSVYQYNQQSLYQIQADYNAKFNAAPSGSAKESYCRQIRDIARRQLGM